MFRRASKLIAAAALTIVTAVACPLAYVINFSGQFGVLDLATGVFTPVGPGLENTPDGLAGAPGGPFYTVDGVTGHLLKLEMDGKVTDVGDTHTGANTGPNGISLVGALTDGTLYGLDFSNKLYRINPATAALTLIGTVAGLPPQENEYDGNMTTSLNGDATQLFYTVEIVEGPRAVPAKLYTINPTTLAVSVKPLELRNRVIGSGMVNGTFYLFADVGEIVRVNTTTAETNVVAQYDSGLTEDTPPFTGIFGVIGALEPNTLSEEHPVARPAHAKSRAKWPPRFAPLPAKARLVGVR